jgi:hypothetical protein
MVGLFTHGWLVDDLEKIGFSPADDATWTAPKKLRFQPGNEALSS